jgi:diketogulonate reductase-like aldo/keto reductase
MDVYCGLSQGYIPLPKSVKRERIRENKNVFDFELSEEEMERLYALDECESRLATPQGGGGDGSLY